MKNNSIFKRKKIPYNFIWTKKNPISYITEEYQKFMANLEYVNVDKKIKAILITSTISSEGKTTFLSNVAYLLAQKKYKTLLIDLDLRKPKVHRIYDVPNNKGVTDILAGRIELDSAIRTKREYGFDCITAGEKTSTVTNLIESDKMKKLFLELREKYDYILVDAPPVINVSDSLYISKLTDGVIFVVDQHSTKRNLIKEAVRLLKQNNVNIIGAAITQVDLRKSGYGYGYGYDYSYEIKKW